MIKTSTGLKANIRNLSGGDSDKAQYLIRNYMMERFLERISLSKYGNNFILKGGILVASVSGLDMRATMDIDASVKSLSLDKDFIRTVIEEIADIDVDDGIFFAVQSIIDIMADTDYQGVRLVIEASLDRLRQHIKIDISTDDVITPAAKEYSYKLMFENRYISLLAYNLETLLSEKLETIISRGIANTRMRDYYDVFIILDENINDIDISILKQAFSATTLKRNSVITASHMQDLLAEVHQDTSRKNDWDKYVDSNYYVLSLTWDDVMGKVIQLADIISK